MYNIVVVYSSDRFPGMPDSWSCIMVIVQYRSPYTKKKNAYMGLSINRGTLKWIMRENQYEHQMVCGCFPFQET